MINCLHFALISWNSSESCIQILAFRWKAMEMKLLFRRSLVVRRNKHSIFIVSNQVEKIPIFQAYKKKIPINLEAGLRFG